MISVLPVEVVPEEAWTGEQVQVKGYLGNSELARVEIVLVRSCMRRWH